MDCEWAFCGLAKAMNDNSGHQIKIGRSDDRLERVRNSSNVSRIFETEIEVKVSRRKESEEKMMTPNYHL
jgi:hypothetical protein